MGPVLEELAALLFFPDRSILVVLVPIKGGKIVTPGNNTDGIYLDIMDAFCHSHDRIAWSSGSKRLGIKNELPGLLLRNLYHDSAPSAG